ncbi:acetylcholinesterase isoform E4-E6 precursor [Oopsacas minuta]|uniref:Acetylcholinesterase isoform E4-E6 n=1 Tax=Oopsacas minuta TaxID=111878 RepID=A0AAV7KDJ7_9METZ|nr:acetylcholinesterase isoform E4-E6 precursor [Oopsacas minuta]
MATNNQSELDLQDYTQIATLLELTDQIRKKRKIKIVLENRQLVLINDNGKLYCLDEFCYHAGGPLSLGDIEDYNGTRCITCPWHRNKIELDTGDNLYTTIDPFTRQTKPGRKKFKQRTHKVVVNGEGVFVKLSTKYGNQNEFESDFYYQQETQQALNQKQLGYTWHQYNPGYFIISHLNNLCGHDKNIFKDRKSKMTSLLFLLLVCSIIRVHTQSVGDSITIDLPFGSVKGYSNGDSWEFYGIPFAAPPVGNLRWQPPSNFTPWSGSTLDAKDPPPACIQKCEFGIIGCAANMSEDCLYLNIFIPISWRPGSIRSYDILLFIYGGGFHEGTSGCLLYDSRFLANFTDTIIVTFNYRVGALGFLRIPLFDIYGNMGFVDQRMAMQWVKDYISYFGGRGKTTLFGQSAGAISIGAHVASPLSKGLFDNIILESDGWTVPFRDTFNAELLAAEYSVKLDCFTKSCFHSRTADEILAAQLPIIPIAFSFNILIDFVPWSPIIDNINLMNQPYAVVIEMAKNGTLPPAIMGTTTDEGYLFMEPIERESPIKGKLFYDAVMLATFLEDSVSVNDQYNSFYGATDNYLQRLSQIIGDYLFGCSTRSILNAISSAGQKDVWKYIWDRTITYNASDNICYNRACHGAELFYVFGAVSLWGQQFTPNDLNLSRQVQTYWGNMAKSNDPNIGPVGTGLYPAWPRYDVRTGAQMFFEDPIGRLSFNFSNGICDHLDTIGYDRSNVFGNSSVVSSSILLMAVALVMICFIS